MQLLGFPPRPPEAENLGGRGGQSVLYQALPVILMCTEVQEVLI